MGSSIDKNRNLTKKFPVQQDKTASGNKPNCLLRAMPQPTPEHSLRMTDTQEGQTAPCYFNLFLGRKRKYFLIFLILVENHKTFCTMILKKHTNL